KQIWASALSRCNPCLKKLGTQLWCVGGSKERKSTGSLASRVWWAVMNRQFIRSFWSCVASTSDNRRRILRRVRNKNQRRAAPLARITERSSVVSVLIHTRASAGCHSEAEGERKRFKGFGF